MGAVIDYLRRKYGIDIDIRETPDLVLAAAAIQPVLIADPNRFGWTIINQGAGIANLSFPGVAPTATHGIRFAAAGGWRSTVAEFDGPLPTNALNGYSLAGTTLYIQEMIAI